MRRLAAAGLAIVMTVALSTPVLADKPGEPGNSKGDKTPNGDPPAWAPAYGIRVKLDTPLPPTPPGPPPTPPPHGHFDPPLPNQPDPPFLLPDTALSG